MSSGHVLRGHGISHGFTYCASTRCPTGVDKRFLHLEGFALRASVENGLDGGDYCLGGHGRFAFGGGLAQRGGW